MRISKTYFRVLLLCYVIVVALNFLSDTWTASVVPDIVKELEPSIQPTESMVLWISQGIFLVSTLVMGLMGFVGMFFFWSPARYIYLIAVVYKILLMLPIVSWQVHTNWEECFGETELFLDGVILTLCFLGPAKYLFVKNRDRQNCPSSIKNENISETEEH